MRIVIETDEQSGAAGSRAAPRVAADDAAVLGAAGNEPGRGATATDAGPPSAQLLQAIGEAGALPLAQGGGRDGVDGGGPPLELVQALRRVPSDASASARTPEGDGNGGGAPQ
ncbi:hypothetical protein [Massilia sp. BJB1822]|uniref:hypothetical protein n=1 Tax=Massilia sp. BJB1822 TaxID=2744470 RepID=UPI0015949F50|nr:hypothetical protein [Massilia sp. BJB1822]NVD96474.1 hypothetical protein [Massilia sp. BJB1822]